MSESSCVRNFKTVAQRQSRSETIPAQDNPSSRQSQLKTISAGDILSPGHPPHPLPSTVELTRPKDPRPTGLRQPATSTYGRTLRYPTAPPGVKGIQWPTIVSDSYDINSATFRNRDRASETHRQDHLTPQTTQSALSGVAETRIRLVQGAGTVTRPDLRTELSPCARPETELPTKE